MEGGRHEVRTRRWTLYQQDQLGFKLLPPPAHPCSLPVLAFFKLHSPRSPEPASPLLCNQLPPPTFFPLLSLFLQPVPTFSGKPLLASLFISQQVWAPQSTSSGHHVLCHVHAAGLHAWRGVLPHFSGAARYTQWSDSIPSHAIKKPSRNNILWLLKGGLQVLSL